MPKETSMRVMVASIAGLALASAGAAWGQDTAPAPQSGHSQTHSEMHPQTEPEVPPVPVELPPEPVEGYMEEEEVRPDPVPPAVIEEEEELEASEPSTSKAPDTETKEDGADPNPYTPIPAPQTL